MAYSLSTAATAAGVQKSTVFRWIKAGKVSATRTDDGQYRIDPAELQRHLASIAQERLPKQDAVRTETAGSAGDGASATDAEAQRAADALRAEVARLQALLDAERQRADEWKATADRWATQAERLALAAPAVPTTSSPPEPRRFLGIFRRAG